MGIILAVGNYSNGFLYTDETPRRSQERPVWLPHIAWEFFNSTRL